MAKTRLLLIAAVAPLFIAQFLGIYVLDVLKPTVPPDIVLAWGCHVGDCAVGAMPAATMGPRRTAETKALRCSKRVGVGRQG